MQKINYQLKLDAVIDKLKEDNAVPRLMLHSCCAPCSSYVLEYLSRHFFITVLYYNPNISPFEEYEYRKAEQHRLISEGDWTNPVSAIDCDWDSGSFEKIAHGLELAPEGGARCRKCYELRLGAAARIAKENGADYFATTLTVSPLKNSQIINETGLRLEKEYGVKYLPSDFKKRGGFKRSVELSGKYGLYRQNYCGCVFSKNQK